MHYILNLWDRLYFTVEALSAWRRLDQVLLLCELELSFLQYKCKAKKEEKLGYEKE